MFFRRIRNDNSFHQCVFACGLSMNISLQNLFHNIHIDTVFHQNGLKYSDTSNHPIVGNVCHSIHTYTVYLQNEDACEPKEIYEKSQLFLLYCLNRATLKNFNLRYIRKGIKKFHQENLHFF